MVALNSGIYMQIQRLNNLKHRKRSLDDDTDSYFLPDYVYREDVDQLRKDGLIPNIPTQPMGYEDAKNFLMLLKDTDAVPKEWEGKISGITYKIGGQLSGGQ